MVAGHWWTSDRCLALCRILHYARALCAGSALKREIRYVLCGPWREAVLQISFCLSVCPCALYPGLLIIHERLEMWANAQPDGRPAEYRWRPLLNAAVWLTPTTRVPCSNAAKTRNQLKLAGVPQTNETISAASRPKFTILWGHLEEILLLNRFFRLSICAIVAKI